MRIKEVLSLSEPRRAREERVLSEKESQEVESVAREANLAKSLVPLPLVLGIDGPSKQSAETDSVQAE